MLHEVEDIGNRDAADVTEFPPLDKDEDVGEGRIIGQCETPEEALAVAESLGAEGAQWINAGVVCDEYLDYSRSRNS